jgi:hypothetical protein
MATKTSFEQQMKSANLSTKKKEAQIQLETVEQNLK